MEKIICDKCNNYEVHPSGCWERCNECSSAPFSYMTKQYAEERMNGNKKNCKCFKKLGKLKG